MKSSESAAKELSNCLPSNSNSVISISSPAYEKIKKWSEERQATLESVLNYLIEQEAERLTLLNYADEDSDHDTQRYSKIKEITELCGCVAQINF